MKRILLLSANPKNTDKLRLDEEIREIQIGLERSRKRDQFEIITQSALRVDDLRRALLDREPHIVHFSGHGAGANGLALENNSGQMQLVSTASLAQLFGLFQDKIECVVLNACYSETQAEAIHQHIDCVVGMNNPIGDRAAIEFAVGFYDALGAGRSYQDAFKFGCNAIDLQGIPESAIPVLKHKFKKSSPLGLGESPKRPAEFDQSQENFQYDVYISYVEQEPDTSWVWDVLLPRLERANLRIAVSGDMASPGVARVVNIENGIRQAQRTIIVLSAAYLANYEATFENILGQTMGIQEGTYRLLPIKALPFDSGQLPTRLSMLTTLDLAHPHRAEREFERLIQALREPLPQM
jgi:hypothetical protein